MRLTQPPLGRGHLLACPVDRFPGPPGRGVGVLPFRAPVMCLPRSPLRRPLRAGLFLLPTSAAPFGEFVPRRALGRVVRTGGPLTWGGSGPAAARGELGRRGERAGQAPTGPLLRRGRVGEYGQQRRLDLPARPFGQGVPRLAGEVGGLPGQGGHDAAPLCGQLLEAVGVQGAVRLAQRPAEFQEPSALLGQGTGQQVRRPRREGGPAGRVQTAGVLLAAGGSGGPGVLLAEGDEVGRRRGVQQVEHRLDRPDRRGVLGRTG